MTPPPPQGVSIVHIACSALPLSLLCERGLRDSHHEVTFPYLFVCPQLVDTPLMPDHAFLDDVGAVTHLQGKPDILLGQQDTEAALLAPEDPLPYRLHHERGQALGPLIHEQ